MHTQILDILPHLLVRVQAGTCFLGYFGEDAFRTTLFIHSHLKEGNKNISNVLIKMIPERLLKRTLKVCSLSDFLRCLDLHLCIAQRAIFASLSPKLGNQYVFPIWFLKLCRQVPYLEHFDGVTVLFCSFSKQAVEKMCPEAFFEELEDIYSTFDVIVER